MIKERILILTIYVIISIISLGCIYKEEFTSETGKFISKSEKGKFNDLEITTELEKTTFKKGERINVLFILKNNGNILVQLDNQGFDAGIYNLDNNIITYIRGDRDETKPSNLGSGVSFIESLDWYQIYDVNGEERDLGTGKYYLIGYLKAEINYKDESGEHKIDPYTIKTKPMTITIE
jgi:hypothetical protein